MSIAEKLTTIAKNEPKVYDAGIDAVWESLQNGGKRSAYTSSIFTGIKWTKETFKPKYPIIVTGTGGNELVYNTVTSHINTRDDQISLIEMEEEMGFPIFDTSSTTYFARTFATMLFKDYGTIDMSSDVTYNALTFYGGYAPSNKTHLRPNRIEHLICSATTPFITSTFQYATELEYIGFEGVIAKNGLDLQWSTKLNKESITKLIGVLSAETTDLTVTISQTAKENAFTDDEWATLIATKANWTISLL